MQQVIEAYEKAHGFYENLAGEQGAPWMLRCRAISRDLSYWLVSDPSEKRRLLLLGGLVTIVLILIRAFNLS